MLTSLWMMTIWVYLSYISATSTFLSWSHSVFTMETYVIKVDYKHTMIKINQGNQHKILNRNPTTTQLFLNYFPYFFPSLTHCRLIVNTLTIIDWCTDRCSQELLGAGNMGGFLFYFIEFPQILSIIFAMGKYTHKI